MIRGLAALSLCAGGGFVLYIEVFLNIIPWWGILCGIVGVLAGIWLMGTDRFEAKK